MDLSHATKEPSLMGPLSDVESKRLRSWLVRFLRAKGAPEPEDAASETVLRILQRLKEGLQVRNLDAFANKVAQNVMHEDWRYRFRHSSLDHSPIDEATHDSPIENERLMQCLDRCKRSCLKRSEVRLIEAYYSGDHTERTRLARRQGMSENALRLKAFKLRKKLRVCVERCREDGFRPGK